MPVQGGDGNDVAGADAEAEKTAGKAQHAVHELRACPMPVAGDGDCRMSPESGYAAEAVANVGLRVISHPLGRAN